MVVTNAMGRLNNIAKDKIILDSKNKKEKEKKKKTRGLSPTRNN